MSSYRYAGQYSGQLFASNSKLLKVTAVSVYLRDRSTLASLYTDRTKTTARDNPLVSDAVGNLSFYVDPGEYSLLANGGWVDIEVGTDPSETALLDEAQVWSAIQTVPDGSIAQAKVAGLPDALAANANAAAAEAARAEAAEALAELLAHKNQPGGYAGLDGSSLLNPAQIPALPESRVTGLTADLAATEKTINKGIAGGYPSLDGGGKIPAAQLPAIAFNTVWPVASQAAMLAVAAEPGDVAIRTDISASFILQALPASTLANWQQLPDVAAPVASVDGLTGAVVLPGDGAAGTATKRTLGTSATQAAAGNDARLSDQRVPTDGSVTDAKVAAISESKITNLVADLAAHASAIAAVAAWRLGASNGSDDTSWINAILAAAGAGSYVRGTPGQTYKISAPLLLRPGGNTTLDMTGCTIVFANTSVQTNMLQNGACVPTATAADVTTTSGSSVITSPALVAAGAAAGMQVGVVAAGVTGGGSGPAGRIWLYGTIQSVSGNNITLGGNANGVAASVSLTNATGYLFAARDRDVTVIGGIWDAGTNWNVWADRYNAAYNSDLLRFRRCDGLTVRDVKLAIDVGYQTSGLGWCFGIAPADCTDILIDHCGSAPGKTASTVINTSGLISRMVIRNIFGTTYDDHVAVGTVGAPFDDIEGDITDVLIDGMDVNGSLRAVDLYCGQGSNGAQRNMTNVSVRSIKGAILTGAGSATAPIRITNYAGNALITADLKDITVFKLGSGGFQVDVAAGQANITVTGPNTGSDLAVSTTTSNTPTGVSNGQADILTVTFNAPPSGAVWIEFGAYSIGQGSASGNLIAYITDGSNNVKMQSFLGTVAGNGFSNAPFVKTKVTGLTSGTQYTFKARASTSAANAGSVLAAAGYPAYLRAVAA